MIAAAAFVAPIGVMAVIDDGKVTGRDFNFPSFAKTLGSLAGTMGINPNIAMNYLDRETVGSLEPLVNTLHKSLSLELSPSLSWERFIRDSGSELMNRCTRIFNDAINLGGDPAEIGKIVSSSSLAIVLLRMKRKPVSTNFAGLVILLHTAMSALLIFIIEIIVAFNNALATMFESSGLAEGAEGAMSGMTGLAGSFGGTGSAELTFLYQFTVTAIFIMTISNTFATMAADGGAKYKIFFYGAIMTAVSGLVMLVVPGLVSTMFAINV